MDIKIQDDSGDKSYFTIIPNYILNHSTATAQALYLQLKRLAGESGETFCSRKYLMDKLKITKPTLIKELNYLLEKKWISEVSEKTIKTNSGIQKVKSYKINNLWKMNSDFYEGSKKTYPPYEQGGKKNDTEVVKGGSKKETHKEEPLEEEPYKEEPVWLDKEVWNNWVEYRKEKKQKLTPRTIKLQLKFLEENKTNHKDIINQSILNGWTGLFPLKNQTTKPVYQNNETQTQRDDKMNKILAKVIQG